MTLISVVSGLCLALQPDWSCSKRVVVHVSVYLGGNCFSQDLTEEWQVGDRTAIIEVLWVQARR